MRKTTSTKRTRKKTKKPSGVRTAAGLARAIAWTFLLLGLLGVAGVRAAGKKVKQPSFALIAGTVFRDSGFALPGAEVSLKPTPEGAAKPKIRSVKTISDRRGEFAMRVPAAPMRYTVRVKAQGFREQSKPVSISGDERVDVYFHLEAELKK
jgi:hypothetical protein